MSLDYSRMKSLLKQFEDLRQRKEAEMFAGKAPPKTQAKNFATVFAEVHDPEKYKDVYEIPRAKRPLKESEGYEMPETANEQRAENSLPPLKESEEYRKPIVADLIPTLLLERQAEIETMQFCVDKTLFQNSLILVKVDTSNNPYMTESVMERIRKEIQSTTSSKVIVLDKNISLEVVPLNQFMPPQTNAPTEEPKQPSAQEKAQEAPPMQSTIEQKASPAETFFSLQFSQKGSESIRVAIFLWIVGLLIAWFLR